MQPLSSPGAMGWTHASQDAGFDVFLCFPGCPTLERLVHILCAFNEREPTQPAQLAQEVPR